MTRKLRSGYRMLVTVTQSSDLFVNMYSSNLCERRELQHVCIVPGHFEDSAVVCMDRYVGRAAASTSNHLYPATTASNAGLLDQEVCLPHDQTGDSSS